MTFLLSKKGLLTKFTKASEKECSTKATIEFSDREYVFIPEEIDGELVRGISAGCFAGEEQIKAVFIPKGVEVIHKDAFKGCRQLESVIFPIDSSLRVIRPGAFWDTNLKYIYLPQKTRYFLAFNYELFYDYMPEPYSHCGIKVGVMSGSLENMVNKPDTEHYVKFYSGGDILIPDKIAGSTVLSIGADAFANYANLGRIYVSKTVRTIEQRAFNRSSFLGLYFEKDSILTSVLKDAFYGSNLPSRTYCEADRTLTLPSPIKILDDNCFGFCDFEAVNLCPSGSLTIRERAFYNSHIRELNIVQCSRDELLLGPQVFYINSIASVDLSKTNIKEIPYGCFACNLVEDIIFSPDTVAIKEGAFRTNSLSELDLSKTNITAIETEAFGRNSLTRFVPPPYLSHVGEEIFESSRSNNSDELQDMLSESLFA